MDSLKKTLVTITLTAALTLGTASFCRKSKSGDDAYHWKHISEPAKQEYIVNYFPSIDSNIRDKLVKDYFPSLPDGTKGKILLYHFTTLPKDKLGAVLDSYMDSISYGDKAKYFGKETWKETKEATKWLIGKVQDLLNKEEVQK